MIHPNDTYPTRARDRTPRSLHALSAAVVLFLTATSPGNAPAQRDERIIPGSRIRIWTRADTTIIGTFRAFALDTVVIQPGASASTGLVPLRLWSGTIQRLDLSRGVDHAGGRGASIGRLIGIPAGAAWGYFAHQQCEPSCFAESAATEVIVGALLGAGAGTIVGYLVGASRRREIWSSVPLAALTPTP